MMKVFQLEISKYSYLKFFKEITGFLQNTENNEKGKVIFTPNPEICLKTLEDKEFLLALQQADYLTSDGIGLYLAYQINDFLAGNSHFRKGGTRNGVEKEGLMRNFLVLIMLPYYIYNILCNKPYLYKKYGERICGSDITGDLLYFCEAKKIRVAIIDPYYPKDFEKCESQRTFREKLSLKFPELLFDFYIYSEEKSDAIFTQIQQSEAQVLFSTLGMKKQELSVLKGLQVCPNLKLGLGIGSSFDYFIGFQKRAPKIFRDYGFEWLYRIFTSPNKLKRIGRIYQALIVFPVKVLLYKN